LSRLAVVATRYWHALADGRVQGDLCRRACKLRDGQRGLCFVRARRGEGVVLTAYGRSSGLCVDPIEKKPLNHLFPGTSVLSFGTAGCDLACRFCQNWHITKSREVDTLAEQASAEQIADTAERLGCPSVAFTYNDPVVFRRHSRLRPPPAPGGPRSPDRPRRLAPSPRVTSARRGGRTSSPRRTRPTST
jgi:pyruvate formate lyase activating enzyme